MPSQPRPKMHSKRASDRLTTGRLIAIRASSGRHAVTAAERYRVWPCVSRPSAVGVGVDSHGPQSRRQPLRTLSGLRRLPGGFVGPLPLMFGAPPFLLGALPFLLGALLVRRQQSAVGVPDAQPRQVLV